MKKKTSLLPFLPVVCRQFLIGNAVRHTPLRHGGKVPMKKKSLFIHFSVYLFPSYG